MKTSFISLLACPWYLCDSVSGEPVFPGGQFIRPDRERDVKFAVAMVRCLHCTRATAIAPNQSITGLRRQPALTTQCFLKSILPRSFQQ